jgi:sulfite dehydrogenase (cytochrome) subunit B
MKKTFRLVIAVLVIGAIASWERNLSADEGAKATTSAGGVHSITLPAMQPELPAGPGRDTAAATCVICHSTRYITMQPRFSRAAWTAEVDKMRKTFGAPLTDAQAAEVVNYLVAIRGAEGAK